MAKKYIDKVIDDAKKHGYDVRIRDVGYAILCSKLDDANMAYMLIFGDDGNLETFSKLDRIKYLVRYFQSEKLQAKEKDEAAEIANLIAKSKGKKTDNSDGSMTFEENREGIEKQLREIVELKKDAMNPTEGEGADLKTLALLQKTEADLRVKLNDKFGAAEKTAEQYIIVQPKFNRICPYTRHECYEMTEEYAMEHFHLIKDPDYEGDNEQ